MPTFTLDQIKSVCPWGVFRWTESHPGRREGWCVLTTEPSAFRAATSNQGEYLDREQVLDALSEPWRECPRCERLREDGAWVDDGCPNPRDQHPELRALITRLLIENCPTCGGRGTQGHMGLPGGSFAPCRMCQPLRASLIGGGVG